MRFLFIRVAVLGILYLRGALHSSHALRPRLTRVRGVCVCGTRCVVVWGPVGAPRAACKWPEASGAVKA